MKSLIVVDSINGVRRNNSLFDRKNTDIVSLDFIASEFLKTNFKVSSTNIFDYYKKSERMKIFSRSVKSLILLLKKLDRKYSKKISSIIGVKKMNVYQPLFLNILFYEFFTIYYFRIVFKKILSKNKYNKIYFIKDSSQNFSKVFKLEDQISHILKKSSPTEFIILEKNEKNFLKNIYLLFKKLIPNYKKIFSIISNFTELAHLSVKNFKSKKNCLFFFKEYISEKTVLKNDYKIFNMKKISNIKNSEIALSKANTFFEKILNNKNNDENFVNLYFQKNLNLYLNPLINFLIFFKKRNLDFVYWASPVVNIFGYNLIIEYLIKKKIKIIGRQHGANYIDCISPVQHFEMDFNRCNNWLSFAADEKVFKKTYLNKKKFCKIIPAGKISKINSLKSRKEIDILFPIQSLNDYVNSRPIEKELYINHKLILKTLDKRKNKSVFVKPGLGMKNSISEDYLFNKFKNIKFNRSYSLSKFLNIYRPNLIILDWYSTPLYEILELDTDIFMVNETVEKISNHAKKLLKKRVHLFDNIKNLIGALDKYDTKKIKKLRDNSFYKTYVNKGDFQDSLETII